MKVIDGAAERDRVLVANVQLKTNESPSYTWNIHMEHTHGTYTWNVHMEHTHGTYTWNINMEHKHGT